MSSSNDHCSRIWESLPPRRAALPALQACPHSKTLGTSAKQKGVASTANRYKVMLTEMLNKAEAPASSPKPSSRRVGCHMALLSALLDGNVFGPLTDVIRSIYEEVKNALYTLDHDMELSPRIVSPCSDLARVPYFVLAETLAKELRKVAADAHQAKEAAADREQLQSEVASLQAANLRILSELTARNTELEDKRRMLQEQVDSLQMEIAAIKHVHSEELKQRDAEKATAREHELHLEKQLKILCKADDRILRKKEHNRLLQQAGLVPSEATEAQDEDERLRTRDLTEQEEASKMQQQILQLLSLQVRELQAAYPHIVDDAAASEQIYKIFTHEADLLSTAVMDLSETIGRLESKEAPVHSTATLKMPHELGHRMAVDGEVLPEHSLESDDATSSKAENAKGNDRAMQGPLWRQFLRVTKRDCIFQEHPRHLPLDHLQRFMINLFWQYMRESPLTKATTNVATFLLQQLIMLYKHEEAANLVMQDVVHTIHVNEDLDAIWKLFSDILSESISHAKWHYLLLMYAYLLPSSPKGSFGLKDLYRILRSLYPKSGDDGLQKLLLQFRESGLMGCSTDVLCFLISGVRSGSDPRFRKHLALLKAKDVKAMGALNLRQFLQFCSTHFPGYSEESLTAWYATESKALGVDVVPYESLLPVTAVAEMSLMIETSDAEQGKSTWSHARLEML